MNDSAQCEFTLETLGPSPFHAEFMLIEAEGETRTEYVKQQGYDWVLCYFSRADFENNDAVVEHFIEELRDDVDLFYMIVRRGNLLMATWQECRGAVATLMTARRTMGRFRRTLDSVWPLTQTDDVVEAIASFRLLAEDTAAEIAESIASRRFIRESPIWPWIKRERRTFPKYDTSSLENLLNFVEQRLTHRQRLANALMAPLLGALAGATVYFFLGKPHP